MQNGQEIGSPSCKGYKDSGYPDPTPSKNRSDQDCWYENGQGSYSREGRAVLSCEDGGG